MVFKDFLSRVKLAVKGPFKIALKKGLHCGKGVRVMGGVNFGSEPYLITLGDRVGISNGVLFITHDGGSWAFRHRAEYKGIRRFGKISVGEGSLIGARSVIMPGVKIGKNCVIGVGAVVTKDVPDNSVAVGIPAKVVCDVDSYAQKMKARMPAGWDENEYKKNKREYLERILPD